MLTYQMLRTLNIMVVKLLILGLQYVCSVIVFRHYIGHNLWYNASEIIKHRCTIVHLYGTSQLSSSTCTLIGGELFTNLTAVVDGTPWKYWEITFG